MNLPGDASKASHVQTWTAGRRDNGVEVPVQWWSDHAVWRCPSHPVTALALQTLVTELQAMLVCVAPRHRRVPPAPGCSHLLRWSPQRPKQSGRQNQGDIAQAVFLYARSLPSSSSTSIE
jgi:hypothetical protein